MPDGELSKIVKVLEAMWRALRELEARVDAIEKQLFTSDSSVMLDETHVPEKQGSLGGKTLLTTPSGGVKRVIRHAFCDICGTMLATEVKVCMECGRKLCGRCAARYSGRNLCIECLQSLLQLDRKDFKVLLSVANGRMSITEISECTGMIKRDIVASLSKLRSLRLIYRRGLSIFSRVFVTDDGLSALGAYVQIYGCESDIAELLKKLAVKEESADD